MGSITSTGGNRRCISVNVGQIVPMPRVPLAGRNKGDGETPQTFRLPDWWPVTIDQNGNVYKSPLSAPPPEREDT